MQNVQRNKKREKGEFINPWVAQDRGNKSALVGLAMIMAVMCECQFNKHNVYLLMRGVECGWKKRM